VGNQIPVQAIKLDLGIIRESCDRLKVALTWDGAAPDDAEVHYGRNDAQLADQHYTGSEVPRWEDRLPTEFPAGPIDEAPNLIDVTVPNECQRRTSNSSQITMSTMTGVLPYPQSPTYATTEGSSEAVDSFPLPIPFNTNTVGPIQLVKNKTKFEDTAISTTGVSVALLERSRFKVFSFPKDRPIKCRQDLPLVCEGPADETLSTYHRVALSDRVLCIACYEGHIDIHDAKSGAHRYALRPHRKCDDLLLSPNAKVLAVALVSGEVFCYPVGAEGKFDTMPIRINAIRDGTPGKGANFSMAFSPNSAYICVGFEQAVGTYSLNIEKCIAKEISLYTWNVFGESSLTGHGITGVALFGPPHALLITSTRDSTSLVVLASAKDVYPLHLCNATSRRYPEPISLGKAYEDTCCIAYSPVHHTALMLGRNGILNIASFTKGKLSSLSKKKLDWSHCKLGFSENGLVGIALDQFGTLLGVKISALPG